MRSFDAASADEAWRLAVDAIKDGTDVLRQNGRGGYTSELLHVTIHVHDSRQRWVVSRAPALSVAFAIVEVIGILNGRRDSSYLNFFNPLLPKYAGTGAEYHGAYGHRLRNNLGFDQLDRASNALKTNGDGRQVVLQIWDATLDFPSDGGTPVADDIPCNICSMLKVRNGRLEWSQIMRSNDIFLGLPHNFVQFMTLQEVLAGWIGIEPGTYTHFADSLHLYEKNADDVFSSIPVPMTPTSDSLALPKHEADPIWREMNKRVDALVQKELTPKEYRTVARLDDAPQAFGNLMAVVAADAARRRKSINGVHEAIALCENPILMQLWERWAEEERGLIDLRRQLMIQLRDKDETSRKWTNHHGTLALQIQSDRNIIRPHLLDAECVSLDTDRTQDARRGYSHWPEPSPSEPRGGPHVD